jgi:hypothetical protein
MSCTIPPDAFGEPALIRKGPAVELDGKSLDNWNINWTRADLLGKLVPGGPVWCQFMQRRSVKGFSLIPVAAGKHKLKLSGGDFTIEKTMVTNDLSFKPEGKLNTLFPGG